MFKWLVVEYESFDEVEGTHTQMLSRERCFTTDEVAKRVGICRQTLFNKIVAKDESFPYKQFVITRESKPSTALVQLPRVEDVEQYLEHGKCTMVVDVEY
jgi:predicted DNA-binding transcriptional regulator AlpA